MSVSARKGRGPGRGPVLLAAAVVAALLGCAGPAGAGPAGGGGAAPRAGERVIFAVRHAEKADDSRDPALSAAGEVRAAELAVRLAPEGVERVLSTDFERTRATARPTAEAAGVAVELYDPRDIDGLARMLLDAPERAILVVGHSNTTPALVEALTGRPAEPMPDAEYDRLYRVRIDAEGAVIAVAERF